MGKKNNSAKKEAKKLRQAAKQEKTANKRNKKEMRAEGEETIEEILASFRSATATADTIKTKATVSVCAQPTRRSNFSLTSLPTGDMLMFGGESCDGERTTVYNDLYRWNTDKAEWRLIDVPNAPPPRCSHQAVLYNHTLYVFGGEYATLEQFHHYRDLWSFDVKTNTWTEVQPSCAKGTAWPGARSGHRMLLWKKYLVLFGGFYEVARVEKWFNELWFYSPGENRWQQAVYKSFAHVPKPRSGTVLALHGPSDTLYMYGGYSREHALGAVSLAGATNGASGSRAWNKVHQDMWTLPLLPLLSGAKGGMVDKGDAASDGLNMSKVK